MTVSELSLTKWVEILLLYTRVTILFYFILFWSDYFKTRGKAFSHLQFFSVLILCPTPYPYSLSPHLPTHFFVSVYLYSLNYHFKFSLLKKSFTFFSPINHFLPFCSSFCCYFKKKKISFSTPAYTPNYVKTLNFISLPLNC